jgi:hypothetical protein
VARKPVIRCEICKTDLTTSPGHGWVAWWYEQRTTPVREFTVSCKGACLAAICKRAGGKESASQEFCVCTGDLAMDELASILRGFHWKHRSKPLNKLLSFFQRASKAPTWSPPS